MCSNFLNCMSQYEHLLGGFSPLGNFSTCIQRRASAIDPANPSSRCPDSADPGAGEEKGQRTHNGVAVLRHGGWNVQQTLGARNGRWLGRGGRDGREEGEQTTEGNLGEAFDPRFGHNLSKRVDLLFLLLFLSRSSEGRTGAFNIGTCMHARQSIARSPSLLAPLEPAGLQRPTGDESPPDDDAGVDACVRPAQLGIIQTATTSDHKLALDATQVRPGD